MRSVLKSFQDFITGFFGEEERPKQITRSRLPKMAETPEGRRESPYYRPQPYSDRRLQRYFDALDKKN